MNFNILVYGKKSIVFVLLLFSVNLIYSQELYVSQPLGSDSNSGSESSPFKTINKAISESIPGTTILVMDGLYQNNNYGTGINGTSLNNSPVVNFNQSGVIGSPITLKNLNGHSPKIQFDGAGGIKFPNGVNNIIVEGFEIEGPSASITYEQAIADREYKILVSEDDDDNTSYNHNYFSGKGIWGYGPHNNIIIRNNVVYNTPGSGIRFNDSDYITIENNTVYNTTWWTSSASSAVVYAESISSEGDNGSDIKMIMRGNIIYNNWNRIPFYVTQLPDNNGNVGGNYGTASQDYILDGQGLYVTRSDPDYAGTFLFENNICVNNGKNGINFDHSDSASAIYRNNTLYFNGVHNIIQMQEHGELLHVGNNKVAGIKANGVLNATVVNNIIVTRDNEYSALAFNDITGTRLAVNNIFQNGTYAWPATVDNNLVNVDPFFVSAPTTVNGLIDISITDFSLTSNSPAINAGNPNHTPLTDIIGNIRPTPPNAVSSSSFEGTTDQWTAFGATISPSADEFLSGSNSLLISDRTLNWHSPKLVLTNLLTVGESYTFNVWVKLSDGVSGTTQLTIKNTDLNTYNNLTSSVDASNEEWIQLSADYTHESSDNMFLYVKGPVVNNGIGGDYFIDDFSLVSQGSAPIDFSNIDDVVDIGAYEFLDSTFSIDNIDENLKNIFLYPNPAKDLVFVYGLNSDSRIDLFDLLGNKYYVNYTYMDSKVVSINVNKLSAGYYLIRIYNTQNNSFKTMKLLKK
ncbi:carbohydrate binding domain-containing protein [Flavobacteriaceae bacterium]|nr:carbohydrate binding domain-containing protein [Flavobacteriaceae bacterium]